MIGGWYMEWADYAILNSITQRNQSTNSNSNEHGNGMVEAENGTGGAAPFVSLGN